MAGTYNFTIEQGSKFSRTLTFYDDSSMTSTKDLTGSTWNMQLRVSKESTDKLLELTSADGDIDTTTQDEGKIIINISSLVTKDLTFDSAVYDLERTVSGETYRELEGYVTLSREVTR